MHKRSKISQAKLDELEAEFQSLFVACLRLCARGRWGLFGQNDQADPDGQYLKWPEAKHLQALAYEIKDIRLEFGQPSRNCDRFLELCSLRGANVPGEPKLAATFLEETEDSSSPRS